MMAPPQDPSKREEELMKQIESMRNEIDGLKLSLAREKQLREQAEKEAERASQGLPVVQTRRGSVMPGGGGSNRASREL